MKRQSLGHMERGSVSDRMKIQNIHLSALLEYVRRTNVMALAYIRLSVNMVK